MTQQKANITFQKFASDRGWGSLDKPGYWTRGGVNTPPPKYNIPKYYTPWGHFQRPNITHRGVIFGGGFKAKVGMGCGA